VNMWVTAGWRARHAPVDTGRCGAHHVLGGRGGAVSRRRL